MTIEKVSAFYSKFGESEIRDQTGEHILRHKKLIPIVLYVQDSHVRHFVFISVKRFLFCCLFFKPLSKVYTCKGQVNEENRTIKYFRLEIDLNVILILQKKEAKSHESEIADFTTQKMRMDHSFCVTR